jgi:DNA-binding winged helix-turn-helix (wHTH) protein
MSSLPPERVRFGAFEFDLNTGELRSIAAPDADTPGLNNSGVNDRVLLREQVFQALRMLVEHEGKIVTREEIKSRLWLNHTVNDFDQSINATIKALRRALGDSADRSRYIETLGRRGYRLMPAIEIPDSAPGSVLAFSIATVYAFRNQRDEAFQWLDRAYAQHDTGLISTKVEPLLNNLHGDPRYSAFLKQIRLPAT